MRIRPSALLVVFVLFVGVGFAQAQGAGNGSGLAQRVAALEAALSTLQSGGSAPPMWSGTTTFIDFNFGSIPYRLDVEEFNTAAEYLSVPLFDQSGSITVLKSGYYRISFAFQAFQVATAQLLRNGTIVDSGIWTGTNSFIRPHLARIVRLEAGDIVVLKYSGSSQPINSRLQIEFLGQ